MTHVLRICSWIPVTLGISVVIVFSNRVFLEHKVIVEELVYEKQYVHVFKLIPVWMNCVLIAYVISDTDSMYTCNFLLIFAVSEISILGDEGKHSNNKHLRVVL